LERVEVDFVAPARGPSEVDRVHRDSDVPRYAEQWRIEGDLQEHAVPGRGERPAGDVEARDDAGDQHHRVGLDAPAVELLETVGEEVVEGRALERVPVAEDAVLDALAEGADHGRGRREVHVGHPERDHVVAVLPPLRALRVPPLDHPVEVVGHGASRYHARAEGGPDMRLVIVGAGAIGSAVGALLTKAGPDVTLIGPWPQRVEAMRMTGRGPA